MTTSLSVCTIRNGTGAMLTFGTPCGRQWASGSSQPNRPVTRDAWIFRASSVIGTWSRPRSAAMFWKYL
jgi:hypothetical protein